MGMFDYVNFKMPCPECGKEVTGWQTKDTSCDMNEVEPDVTNNFYAPCDCGCWIEFYRPSHQNKQKRDVPLTKAEVEALGFAMEVRDGGERIAKKRRAMLSSAAEESRKETK